MTNNPCMNYSIDDHTHRFAAWAASRAAMTSRRACSFKVEQGKAIVEKIGLNKLVNHPDLLPDTIEKMDNQHRTWREKAIEEAGKLEIKGFGHGVAAKLINIYLKAIFVCGGYHDHKSVSLLHPPVDSLLIDELTDKASLDKMSDDEKCFWKKAKKWGWSLYSSEKYEQVIAAIRKFMRNEPMWKIESFWRGFQ